MGRTIDLVVGLVSLVLMLFLKTHRMQEVNGHRGCHLDIKRSFVMSDSVLVKPDSLCTVPERVMYVAMRVKLRLQWRCEARDARNVEHLLRKAAGTQQSQPKG